MRSRRLAVAGAGTASLIVLLAACSSSGTSDSGGAGRVNVVASTNVYADIAEQIAGGKGHVTSIVSDPAADPHSYEASTQDQLAVSKADIVIENGGGYDDFVPTMLKAASKSSVRVLNAVDISGKKAADGAALNEHVWYDFPSMAKLADRLASALSAVDAADASTFQANASTFKRKLAGLESTEAAIKSAHAGEGVAITEPVPLYLLEACGFENRTPTDFSEAIEEGTDVSPTVLKDVLDLFSKKEVALLAYNEQTSSPETKKVLDAAKSHGIAVVPVTETLPSGQGYLTWMGGMLSAIRGAVG